MRSRPHTTPRMLSDVAHGPQAGDIFVSHDGRACFIVQRLPYSLPLVRDSHESAMAVAHVVAAYHTVDVWYADGDGVRRVEAHRPDTA